MPFRFGSWWHYAVAARAIPAYESFPQLFAATGCRRCAGPASCADLAVMNLSPSKDPLLQPHCLKHLTLRNRILSTAHEPAYSEGGLPKERYRLYHEEDRKGGIALKIGRATCRDRGGLYV